MEKYRTVTKEPRMIKVGDQVRITTLPPVLLEISDEKDEMHTKEVFQECLGRTFRVRDFDNYGQLELWVHGRDDDDSHAYLESTWVEPEFVEVVPDTRG